MNGRRWGTLLFAVIAVSGMLLVRARQRAAESKPASEPKLMSYGDLVKSAREGRPPVVHRKETSLACAARFAADNARRKAAAEAKAEPPAEDKAMDFTGFLAEARAREKRLDALPFDALVKQAPADDLVYAVLRRIYEKEEEGRAALTPAQRDLLDASTLDGEVENGGFHQYFFNSTGDHALEARDAVRRIGPPQLGEVFDCVLSAFRDSRPSADREQRQDQLEEWGEAQLHVFEALDDAFYELEDERQAAQLKWVRAHAAELALPPIGG